MSDVLETFLDDGVITGVVQQLKSGKEATVWLCRRETSPVAVKVYKERASRAFHNDVVYRAGRPVLDDRVARAVSSKTRFGREAAQALWLDHEYETMRTLHRAGAAVPRPLGRAAGGLAMELVALSGEPAPQLREAGLAPAEAAAVVHRLLSNVELMLREDVVHGDLSPFNVLYGDRGPVIIDFPQAVDPRSNPNARELLFRDVDNVCRWGARHGVEVDASGVAGDLWDRYERAQL